MDKDESDFVDSGYGNTYGWLTLKSVLSSALYAQTVLSAGRVSQDRNGVDFTGGDQEVRASVADVRDFHVYGFKQDWSYDLANRHFLKWGFDAKRLTADYDYFNRERMTTRSEANTVVTSYDTTAIRLDPSGKKFGAYLADRVRLPKSLTAEIGLRYDNTSFYQLVYGSRNAERFPPYHRLDVRVNRYFDLGKGRLSLFLEVINLYNRANIRAYEHSISRLPNGQITVIKEAQKWLPRLPSIGISWEF